MGLIGRLLGRTEEPESKGEEFVCDECGDAFDSETGRNIHAGLVHPEEE